MKYLLPLFALLAACEARGPILPLDDATSDAAQDVTGTDATPASDTATADAAPDAPDSAPDLATGCALGDPCDDADPCTVEDTCSDKGCAGKPKSCDDNSPCTIDACELDGNCSHTPNMHWDCLPDLLISAPDRGAQVLGLSTQLTGTIVTPSHGTQVAKLTAQGKDVAWDKSLAFTVPLVLAWGSQVVTTALVDQFGAPRVRSQGVTASTQWSANGAVAVAGRVDGVKSVPLPQDVTVYTPYSLQPRTVHWQFQPTENAGSVLLAATPTPSEQMLDASQDRGFRCTVRVRR